MLFAIGRKLVSSRTAITALQRAELQFTFGWRGPCEPSFHVRAMPELQAAALSPPILQGHVCVGDWLALFIGYMKP